MLWILIGCTSSRRFQQVPQHMFWCKNSKNLYCLLVAKSAVSREEGLQKVLYPKKKGQICMFDADACLIELTFILIKKHRSLRY